MSYLTEWWYYNGHLVDESGGRYGYELCFFRLSKLGYFAHFAITDETRKTFQHMRKFYDPREVTISETGADLAYGPLGMEQRGEFTYRIRGSTGSDTLDLDMKLEKNPLVINGNGLIDMPEGLSSYYYSLTRLSTVGQLLLNGVNVPVSGVSWMDHQWGNFIACRIGWDWFSFQMEDNTEYNLFSFRNESGTIIDQYVNYLGPDNNPEFSRTFNIDRTAYWESPKTGDRYATRWQVLIPDRDESFAVEATVDGQEVCPDDPIDQAPTYWEGSCNVVRQLRDGALVNGVGYCEQFPVK